MEVALGGGGAGWRWRVVALGYGGVGLWWRWAVMAFGSPGRECPCERFFRFGADRVTTLLGSRS